MTTNKLSELTDQQLFLLYMDMPSRIAKVHKEDRQVSQEIERRGGKDRMIEALNKPGQSPLSSIGTQPGNTT